MKLCPNCGMRVAQADVCPYCKTALTKKDEQAFTKTYAWHLIKTVWFSVVCMLICGVSLIVWSEPLSAVGAHALSFAALSMVFALVQFRAFGKFSRYFHTSTAVYVITVVGKYAFAIVALFIVAVPILDIFV